jgi:hypothetical protein
VRITKDHGEAAKGLLPVGAEINVSGSEAGGLLATLEPGYAIVLQAGSYEAIGWDEPTPAADNDAWRKVGIAALGLPEKLADQLPQTLGELEDLRAAISQHKKEWPKGIGAAKITKIEDAIVGYLAKPAPTAAA